jgi:hypothetical protein
MLPPFWLRARIANTPIENIKPDRFRKPVRFDVWDGKFSIKEG